STSRKVVQETTSILCLQNPNEKRRACGHSSIFAPLSVISAAKAADVKHGIRPHDSLFASKAAPGGSARRTTTKVLRPIGALARRASHRRAERSPDRSTRTIL